MPAIHFDITADNQQVLQSLQQTMQAITNLENKASVAGESVEEIGTKSGKGLASMALRQDVLQKQDLTE